MATPARHEESAIPARAHLAGRAAGRADRVGLNAAILAVRGDEPVVAVVPPRARSARATARFPAVRSRPVSTRRSRRACASGCSSRPASSWGLPGRSARSATASGFGDGAQAVRPAGRRPSAIWRSSSPTNVNDRDGAVWRSWYAYFPWEDWRRGKPACLTDDHRAAPRGVGRACARPLRRPQPRDALDRASACASPSAAMARLGRGEGARALRAAVRGRPRRRRAENRWRRARRPWRPAARLSHPLLGDHARVLASAIGELRRSVKCQPGRSSS